MKKLKAKKLNTQVHKWYWKNFDKLTGFENGRLVDHTRKLRFKKIVSSIKKAVIHLNILSLVLIFACGEDIVNNGNTPPQITIFSQDSLSLFTPPFTKDTTIEINAKNIRVTFTAETNADSINGWSLFKVTAFDTTNQTILDTTYSRVSSINNNFEFTLINAKFITLYIQCLRNPPHVFFMKLKNIKIYSYD